MAVWSKYSNIIDDESVAQKVRKSNVSSFSLLLSFPFFIYITFSSFDWPLYMQTEMKYETKISRKKAIRVNPTPNKFSNTLQPKGGFVF